MNSESRVVRVPHKVTGSGQSHPVGRVLLLHSTFAHSILVIRKQQTALLLLPFKRSLAFLETLDPPSPEVQQ